MDCWRMLCHGGSISNAIVPRLRSVSETMASGLSNRNQIARKAARSACASLNPCRSRRRNPRRNSQPRATRTMRFRSVRYGNRTAAPQPWRAGILPRGRPHCTRDAARGWKPALQRRRRRPTSRIPSRCTLCKRYIEVRHWTRSANRSASFRSKRRRTGLPAKADRADPHDHATGASKRSP